MFRCHSYPASAWRSRLCRRAVRVKSGRMASRFVNRPQWAVIRSGVTITMGSTAVGTFCWESGVLTWLLVSVSLWPAKHTKEQSQRGFTGSLNCFLYRKLYKKGLQSYNSLTKGIFQIYSRCFMWPHAHSDNVPWAISLLAGVSSVTLTVEGPWSGVTNTESLTCDKQQNPQQIDWFHTVFLSDSLCPRGWRGLPWCWTWTESWRVSWSSQWMLVGHLSKTTENSLNLSQHKHI